MKFKIISWLTGATRAIIASRKLAPQPDHDPLDGLADSLLFLLS